jgi:hypothetical protein
MKKILFAAAAMVFATTAEAEWFQKPVQCSTGEDVYNTLIETFELQPMFAAVAQIITPDNLSPAVLIFYMNIESGRFLILETDNVSTCIIGIGDGVDFDITPEEIRNFLLNEKSVT